MLRKARQCHRHCCCDHCSLPTTEPLRPCAVCHQWPALMSSAAEHTRDERVATVIETHTETRAQLLEAEQAAAAGQHQPQEQPPQPTLWYFAIGSMMNPVSMRLRNLFPKQSMPGVLHDWKLVFRGVGGMGDIEQAPGESFHGILHELSCDEFKHLDQIEAIYERRPVTVRTYDGREVEALAYKMNPSRFDAAQPDNLPGERYLDIIMRGARHFGVDPAYISRLEQVPVQARKKVSEYRSVPTPPERVISAEELARGVGSKEFDPAVPLLLAINGKVLRWGVALDDPKVAGVKAALQSTYEWARARYAGSDVTVGVAKTLYEPLYPVPTSLDAMSEAARAWAEELFVGFSSRAPPAAKVTGPYGLGCWEVIGWLEGHKKGADQPSDQKQAEQP